MRSAFCVFFPIGLFWCVISPERRSVQDVVLWTSVVYDWMPRPGASQRKTLLGEAPLAVEPAGRESSRPMCRVDGSAVAGEVARCRAAGSSRSAAPPPPVVPHR